MEKIDGIILVMELCTSCLNRLLFLSEKNLIQILNLILQVVTYLILILNEKNEVINYRKLVPLRAWSNN